MRTKLTDDEISMVLSHADAEFFDPHRDLGIEIGADPDFRVANAFGFDCQILIDRISGLGLKSTGRPACYTIDELAVALEAGISIPRRVLEDGDLSAYDMPLLT